MSVDKKTTKIILIAIILIMMSFGIFLVYQDFQRVSYNNEIGYNNTIAEQERQLEELLDFEKLK